MHSAFSTVLDRQNGIVHLSRGDTLKRPLNGVHW